MASNASFSDSFLLFVCFVVHRSPRPACLPWAHSSCRGEQVGPAERSNHLVLNWKVTCARRVTLVVQPSVPRGHAFLISAEGSLPSRWVECRPTKRAELGCLDRVRTCELLTVTRNQRGLPPFESNFSRGILSTRFSTQNKRSCIA
jgi:hypothetical protein